MREFGAAMVGRVRRGTRALPEWTGLAVALALAAATGIAFALVVPPGLPYDEPSYWATTLHYQTYHSMPVLGHPGVTYEAQQPPVPFVLMSVVASVAEALGESTQWQFRAARMVGGAMLLIAMVLLDRVLALVGAKRPGRFAGLVAIGSVPVFAAVAWSVQNDAAMLMFGLGAVYVALRAERVDGPVLDWYPSSGVGVLIGLAIMSKPTACILVPAVALWLVLRARRDVRRIIVPAVGVSIGTSVIAGWWFVRNLIVYGTIIGSPAGHDGPSFPAAGFDGPDTIFHAARNVVTYLWLPTEYFRNVYHAPRALQTAIAAATASFVVGGVWLAWHGYRDRDRGRDRRDDHDGGDETDDARRGNVHSARVLVMIVGVFAVACWGVGYVFIRSWAFRVAYLAVPLWAWAIAAAVDRVWQTRTRAIALTVSTLLVLFVVALSVWSLDAAARFDGTLLLH